MKKLLIISLSLLIFITSCIKEKTEEPIITNSNSKAIYISNEGAFGYGNASLSVYYPEKNKIDNQVFKTVNKRGLGDVLQSIYHYGNKLYFVVNASSKVEIAKTGSYEELGVIKNILLPRYMIINNNKAYISCWGDGGQIAVINLQDNSIVKKIDVNTGPERIITNNKELVVCNSGGFGTDSSISIIDLSTDKLIKNLYTGDIPIDLSYDSDSSNFYVLCKGKTIYDASWNIIGHTASKLVKISSTTLNIEKEIQLFDKKHPSNIVYNSTENIFYIGGGYGFQGVYRYEIDQEKLDTNMITNRSFYGIESDKDGKLYGFESPDFSSQGNMIIMDSYGNILKEAKVGIGPNGMSL